MKDKQVAPLDRRIQEIKQELEKEMFEEFDMKANAMISNNVIVAFWLRKLAEMKAKNEILEEKINKYCKK